MNSLSGSSGTSGEDAARAREQFLSGSTGGADVRRLILASWQRSAEHRVDADQVKVPHLGNEDSFAPLLQCAVPVLDRLHEQLAAEPVSIILTDRSGTVLDRRPSSGELTERLDSVLLAPGYSYAEEFVGTNGIGTALASGRATLVDGREHYTHPLGQFACAGAPIYHPSRKSVVGVLDLTSWAHSPGTILVALALATARQIEDELRAHTGTRELALFQEYLKACQQPGSVVVALNADVVMTSERFRVVLDNDDQHSALGYATDMLRADHRVLSRSVELPSGRVAHLRATPVGEAADGAAVIRVRLSQDSSRTPGGQSRQRHAALAVPGVVGSSAPWTRCVQQVNSSYEAGDWLALVGEPGTGKRAVLRAIHLAHNPTRIFRVLEPSAGGGAQAWIEELRDAVSVPGSLVVIRRADELDETRTALLVDELLELDARDDPAGAVRIAITMASAEQTSDTLQVAFPRIIEVPPLRHHIDDLTDLVPHLLTQLNPEGRLSLSAQAMAQLRRLDWPGNIAELRHVLSAVLRCRRFGTIDVDDLPAQARTAGHRVLSPIEALERDAIVRALLENNQRPTEAARVLGISRATVYRKIRQYGIAL